MKQRTIELTKIVMIALILSVVISFAQAHTPSSNNPWDAAPGSPPDQNIDTPINVGTVDQIKSAGLALDGISVFGETQINGNTTFGQPQSLSSIGSTVNGLNNALTVFGNTVTSVLSIDSLSHTENQSQPVCVDNGELVSC
ncbi:hypothetical protein COB64_01385 [Candidatus Wolfebacteria bacterium]|nr:MAG: hypothetical protein COB64_01385 [Candidatus Wolfebacteria bacterium]